MQDIWSSGSLAHTINGLRRDTSFDIQVRAVNSGTSNTDGPWSATKEGSTTDHGGSSSAATTLSLGSSLEGSIDPVDDEDYFRIVAPSGTDLWVYTSGELDTTGDLLDSGGSVVYRNYDGRLVDHPLAFSVRYRLNAATYYVKVTSHAGKYTGSYTIHTEAVVDPGSDFAMAKEIELDSKAAGRITPISTYRLNLVGSPIDELDEDIFRFELDSAVEIWVLATTLFRTSVRLYEPFQSVTYVNGGWTYNPYGVMFRKQLPAGTYHLRLRGTSGTAFGPYALYLKTVTEPGDTPGSRTALTLEVPQTGTLTSDTDRDYFSFTLDDDTYLGIYAASFGGAMPIAVDGLSAMTESYEVRQADYSDAGVSAGSYLKWGKLSAGTYDISTSTTNSGGGKYLLHVYTSRYADLVETCTTTLTTTMSDPWYGCQWQLNNTGQFDNGAEHDLNVVELWDSSVPATMGDGIVVAVVDDGLDFTHEDLADNVMTSANRNYHVSHGSIFNPFDRHGTAVASIIAARDNSLGVRGVAPRVKVYGVNLISGNTASNANIAAAMVPSTSSTAISNNSWGPAASGRLVRPAMSWETAVVNGVTDGFGGKGVVYVFSAGNGHYLGDYSNLDGFANFYAVTAVCAVNYADKRSGYSERGSNLWVCGPSSDRSALPKLPGITTAEVEDRYQVDFGGTSAAAPAVSGVAALIRAADRGMPSQP